MQVISQHGCSFSLECKYEDEGILFYTSGLIKYGKKEICYLFKLNSVMHFEFARDMVAGIASSMAEGEQYHLKSVQIITDDNDKLIHAFRLFKSYKYKKMLEIKYLADPKERIIYPLDGNIYLFNPNVDEWIRFDKLVYVSFKKDTVENFDDFELIHIDGDKTNCCLDNLRLVV